MTGGRRPLTLVTGGSGFIGGAVCNRLIARGRRVVATTTTDAERDAGGPDWVRWDALDESLPDVDWTEVDAIIHLAAPRSLFDFPACAEPVFRTCVDAVFRLLEAARHAGVRRFVMASSGDVLDDLHAPATEGEAVHPRSFYGAAKAAAELMTQHYDGMLSTAVARIFHPYGPGGDRFVINRVIARVRAGLDVTVEGDDGIILNPIWIDDLAEGFALAVERNDGGIFHFAGEDVLSFRSLLHMIGEAAGRPPRIVGLPPAGEGQSHCGDCARSRRHLGFRPVVGLREGLARMVG